MRILNKVQHVDYYPATPARIIYDAADKFKSCCGVVPHTQEPRFVLREANNPRIPAQTHVLVINIRKDWIDAAYTHHGCQRGPLCDADIVAFIWGS